MSCTILSAGADLTTADAAVGDVKDGKFFFSVEQPVKEGTMPTVALAAGSSDYPTGYHAGEGGGLPAVDADLTEGNIKSGVTIFGLLGTAGPLFDVEGTQTSDLVGDSTNSGTMGWRQEAIAAGADWTGTSKTIVLSDDGIVIGATTLVAYSNDEPAIQLKLRLFIDGVQVAESIALINYSTKFAGNRTRFLVGHRSCSSGNRVIHGEVHNYGGDAETMCYIYYGSASGGGAVI